jgi:hypothetical protein
VFFTNFLNSVNPDSRTLRLPTDQPADSSRGMSNRVMAPIHVINGRPDGLLDTVVTRNDLSVPPADLPDFDLSDHFLLCWPMSSAHLPQVKITSVHRPWHRWHAVDVDALRGSIQASHPGRPGELREETNWMNWSTFTTPSFVPSLIG